MPDCSAAKQRGYARHWLWLPWLLCLHLLAVAAPETATPALKTCVDCHTVQANPEVHLIFATPHGAGRSADGAVCSGCHGGSSAHREDPLRHPVDVSFRQMAGTDSDPVSAICLNCHKGDIPMAWQGSAHHSEDMSCLGCHQVHVAKDPVLADDQDRICLDCHRDVRAQLHLPSSHPVAAGQTTCTDCHNPHGTATPAALKGITLNDTCYRCHAEKRGPVLFEHAPVAEDCSLCHRPHGSVNPDLLTARTPFLCQQCHSAAFHPGMLNDGSGLPAGAPNAALLGKNCLNCHSQVHGSNHPSGGRLTR